ncbi:sulfurtransferase [Pseudothauera lacus]|uniref:Sulfurtransferase n=1 Tax=Pseudothauera lacus TaxID=2136175 RepID=A0A2T4IE37_9RHOO|nr:sulfurtransferase [Pseudothauera lacus]PTD96035.1 sulfurtransferase [Pseudothauera lacus]
MSAGYATLISAAELDRHLGTPGWVIVDCRHDLANPAFGRDAYAREHLPGAVHLHLDDDLSGPRSGRNGRHPLPDPALLAARLGACGIANDSQVVAYDDAGGMYAARLWWLLRWLGHERVAVLDGGYQAWCAATKVLDSTPARPPAAHFSPRVCAGLAVDADYVAAHLDDEAMVLIDARSPDRFRGENESLDPVGGRIPGACNRFFRDNLDASGRFLPAAQLRTDFTALLGGRPPAAVVNQCGSGVTACHNLLAMEIAGLPGARLYAGSWSEWCADPARPLVSG